MIAKDKMQTCPTFTAQIYLGLKVNDKNVTYDIGRVRDFCFTYAQSTGHGVTISQTYFLYKDEHEPGAIIGLFCNPRLMNSPAQVRENAIHLAQGLLAKFEQKRCYIVMTDETILVGEADPPVESGLKKDLIDFMSHLMNQPYDPRQVAPGTHNTQAGIAAQLRARLLEDRGRL